MTLTSGHDVSEWGIGWPQTVRLAPNDEESAIITFNTGVAQGSITSPQLFNIFINALLRMLTVTGQNEDSSHGLQIRTTHDARTCTLMPNKSVALSASACQVSLH